MADAEELDGVEDADYLLLHVPTVSGTVLEVEILASPTVGAGLSTAPNGTDTICWERHDDDGLWHPQGAPTAWRAGRAVRSGRP